jgi:hypothetical protein
VHERKARTNFDCRLSLNDDLERVLKVPSASTGSCARLLVELMWLNSIRGAQLAVFPNSIFRVHVEARMAIRHDY